MPAPVGRAGRGLLAAGGKLLDSPAISIGIAEEHEPPRQGLLDFSDIYASVAQLRSCGLDVVDDHLESLCGAGWRRGDAIADDDRAARSRRRYLHEPQFIAETVIVVDVVSDSFVERFGRVDVADRYSDDFKPVIHFRPSLVELLTPASVRHARRRSHPAGGQCEWAVLAVQPREV
jgi:hypothetical protein